MSDGRGSRRRARPSARINKRKRSIIPRRCLLWPRRGSSNGPRVVSSDVEQKEPQAGGYSVSLPTFEGPLDLLLHLCQKHELNILDIPIGFVTEKYLEYLAVMQLINLDLASEYLVMAATLAHIKSKMLLPAPPPGQEDDALAVEEEDPRESLIRRLLEYQKYKQAAADLAERGVTGRDVFFRGSKVDEVIDTGLPPLAQVPLFSLVEAFQGVLSRSKITLSHDIVHERMTLTDRINELVDLLREKKRLAFEELFDGLVTRFDLVITFLALLEMTKLRMTRLFQADPSAPIYVEFSAQATSDEEAGLTMTEGVFEKQATTAGEDVPPGGAEADASDEPTQENPQDHAPEEDAPIPGEVLDPAAILGDLEAFDPDAEDTFDPDRAGSVAPQSDEDDDGFFTSSSPDGMIDPADDAPAEPDEGDPGSPKDET